MSLIRPVRGDRRAPGTSGDGIGDDMAGRKQPEPAPFLTGGRILLSDGLRDPDPGQTLNPIPFVVHAHSGQMNPQRVDELSRDDKSAGDAPIEVAHADATSIQIDITDPQMGGGIGGQ